MYHPLCYFNTNNIEITETPPTHPYEEKLAAIIPTIPKMSHAELDKFEAKFCNIRGHRGRRDLLALRRNRAQHQLDNQIKNVRRGQINEFKRAAFIGPLTIQMRNGHPF
jgi:hypothetical protein